jgi:predicted NBD/HSP70 family sugar kinase
MRLGIDFGGTNIKTGIFSEEGKLLFFVENKLLEFTERGDLLDNLVVHAKTVSKDYKLTSGGLAIKGLINTDTGILEDDIGAGALLAGKNLKEAFSKKLSIPFKVENDARAFAWGEYKFGAGQGSKAMVCMTLGTGFGCAVVVDGKPFYGSDVLGGLLGGHISINHNGPECPCGNRGCLELYCSATAFTERVVEAHPELRNSNNILPEFFEKIKSKEKKYFNTLYTFQDDLAIGIVNAIHAYGPDVIVLGGGVMNSAQIILPRLIELVHRRAWTFPRKKVQIKSARLGNKAATYGIAFLN